MNDVLHDRAPVHVCGAISDGRPARYNVPDLGPLDICYDGDYADDLARNALDDRKAYIATSFEKEGFGRIRLCRWALRCTPNHEGRDFAGWQLADVLAYLGLLRDSMPDLQALVDRHFPLEARA